MANTTLKTTKNPRKTLLLGLALLLPGIGIHSCVTKKDTFSGPVRISVSSDGRYALSTHFGRHLILWDIAEKKYTTLNQNSSIHSPYFIPNSPYFLWQDAKTLNVHVQSITGKIIKTLHPGFPVYGHIISPDLKHYIASKDDWSLYRLNNNQMQEMKWAHHGSNGSGRVLQLTYTPPFLLTAGYGDIEKVPFDAGKRATDIYPNMPKRIDYSLLDGVTLWNSETGKPLQKFICNFAKTMVDISPDANYIAGVEENLGFYVWSRKTGKRSPKFMEPTNPNLKCWGVKACLDELHEEMRTNLVIPKDFNEHPWANGARSVAVKFIDEQGHLLRFINSVNYATLYHVDSPKVQAYFNLGKHPQPHTFSAFSSANVIATAPKAHILVMGQSTVGGANGNGSGIIVYRFNPQDKTLKRLWAPDGPGRHREINNPKDIYEG